MKLKSLQFKHIAVFSLLMSITTLFIAGCSGSGGQNTGADGKKVIKIGVFEPLSGENGGGGLQEVWVYGMQIRYIRQ